ncbi:penicillin-binding protein 2 [Magnetospirillum sp. UT-4]|uniref:penicillin-binding protein 2 n=1 Tax=Magnetospirillum sp. UT-4 TaxID=2681467 RepID=UPI00137F2310|nr:penicillin-binding protein 2 [Magnetospirillum sp. UT-4]CAA7620472.1 putative cell division protein FtsI/penicillin-binding protein 2 [Magnetospirillum sp. UT-4]
MYHDNDRSKTFSRRAMMLAGGKAALVSALAGRMYYLQVVESDKYTMLAEDNRVSLRLLAPPRGPILDRNGIAMAINQHNYRVLVVAEASPSLDYTLDALSRIITLTDHDRARIHKETRRRRSFVPITVRENLSWEDVARIEVNAPDLPGVLIDVGQSRFYPLESLGAHILGYVAAVSEADLTNDPLEELPGFRVGKAGVEKIYDLALRGAGGTSSVEVNAVGRVIRELERREGEPGVDLTLTLDIRLQEYAAQRLGDESAAAVVMDIHSGEVIVMASTPSFDPNAFNRGLTPDEWKDLINNPRAPLQNKAISGTFAPGSTFKLIVALAALESGQINPAQTVFCKGHTEMGSIKFHCWKKGGHGSVDLIAGIKHSCDVYFYEVARRVGIDKIAEVARRFGLGVPTGIDLPNERNGLMPDRDWKRKALKQPWHPGETLINGIGQGYCLATPLQLATMTARIANGGLAVVPHVARDHIDGKDATSRSAPNWPSCGVQQKNLALIRKGMNAVSNEPGGTAFRARIDQEGMWLSGKTGTAQVRRITMRERETGVKKNEELPWKERDHALFVAYAPEENPRFAIAVVVEHGGGGSAVAAPIARDIMIEVQKRERARVAGSAGGREG